MKSALSFFAILMGSGCRSASPAEGGAGDLSWLGALIGALIGFGIFFLATYLLSRNSK